MKGLNSPVQRNIQTRETSHATVTEQCQDSWPGFPHRGSGRNGMYGDRQCHRKPSTFGVSTANRPAASVIYVTRGARAISELISILSSLGEHGVGYLRLATPESVNKVPWAFSKLDLKHWNFTI